MPGDEVPVAAGGGSRPRTGPRHAAPRKSIFHRIQVPAGKAIALAAMPTAVLMGMGLTPRLAQADEVGKSPKFAAGPCVTASDTPGGDAAGDGGKDAGKAGKKDEDTGKKDAGEKDGKPSVSPSATPSSPSGDAEDGGKTGDEDGGKADDKAGDETGGKDGEKAGAEAGTPDPSDSASAPVETEKPGLLDPILDPLGLGDLLTGGKKDEDEEPAPDPSTSAPAPGPSSSAPSVPADDGEDDGKDGGKDTGKDDGGKKDSAKTADAEDGKDEETPAGDTDDDEDKDDKGEDASESPSASSSPSPSVNADGETAYPCPEEKKVAGTDELTEAALPNKTWTLESTRLALHGLEYHGVVNLTRQNGETVQALKFTASGLDIDNLHQIVDGENGYDYHVQGREGSTSKFEDSTVTMYTEKLSGNLLGIIPISFDAEHEPPLVIPELFFTDVEVRQVAQFGGTLTIPGMQVYTTPQ